MTIYDWTFIGIAISWMIRLTMVPVVVMRKESPTACLAWLMIVFFEPWFGLGLYLLLGEDRLVRRRLKIRSRVAARGHQPGITGSLSADPALSATGGTWTGQSRGEQLQTIADLAGQAGALAVTDGNSVELIADTDAVIDGLVADIDSARHHVHLMFYIIEDDAVGRRVSEALIHARERGVECRVLADAVGSGSLFRSLAGTLTAHGVEVVAVLPVHPLRRGLERIDLRNHRKLAVIDGCVAWTGSQNVVEASYGHSKAGIWHDLMARITGTAVWQLQVIFLEDWYQETHCSLQPEEPYFPETEPAGRVPLQVVPTGPDRPTEHFQHLMVEAIHAARSRVTITSPYFIPNEALLCALRLASARGVQVELIIPDRSDQWIVDAAGRFYCGLLLRFGVHVHLFEDGLLHSKTLTVDDEFGMFGSANYDIRSFQLNFELNVMVYDAVTTRRIRTIQEQYQESSHLLTLESWQSQSRWKHLQANVAKLFSPLL